MNNIKIYDKTADITKRNIDMVIAPVNRRLENVGVHKTLDYVIYNHRYQLRMQHSLIPNKSKVEYGDIYIIPEERGEQASLMYSVLEPASEKRYEKQLKDFYDNSFQKALEFGARSVRVPSLSHGVFGYPITEVVEIGVSTSLKFEELERIEFFCYNDEYYHMFKKAISAKS